jgi:hypothetical protein
MWDFHALIRDAKGGEVLRGHASKTGFCSLTGVTPYALQGSPRL